MSLPHGPRIIFAGDYAIKPGWVLPTRKLDEYELVYFPDGTDTTYLLNGRSYTLKEPAFIITRPQEEHAYTFDSSASTRHLYAHFYWDSAAGPGEADAAPGILVPGAPPLIPVPEDHIVHAFMKQLLSMASKEPLQWMERCNQLLNLILYELADLVRPSDTASVRRALPAQILHAMEHIDRHFRNPISVAELARQAGWSHEYFTRQFVKHTGMTPQRTVMKRRIEAACQHLLQEDWSIAEIVRRTGFEDDRYFARCFLKMKKMTASGYRARFANSLIKHVVPPAQLHVPYALNSDFHFETEKPPDVK